MQEKQQLYRHYLLIDFEATCCDQGCIPRNEMEIIEFGAVMVDRQTLQEVSRFCRFVRPKRHPVLTDFCRRLTSISQQDVDHAEAFPVVLADFTRWITPYAPYLFCSWGDYDRRQLQQDCQLHRLPNPLQSGHCNVKERFSLQQGLRNGLGLNQAVSRTGMKFSGIHHRGIDDALNIARLLPFIFGEQKIATYTPSQSANE